MWLIGKVGLIGWLFTMIRLIQLVSNF